MSSDPAAGARGEIGAVVTEQEFEDRVLRSRGPVLMAFTADWCAPCRWLYPVLDEITAAHGDAITVLRMDVDRLPSVAAGYRIASVPIVILFRGGLECARSVGVEPTRLREMVAEALSAGSAGGAGTPGTPGAHGPSGISGGAVSDDG